MLTKAVIVEVLDPKSMRVRIPILHQAASSPTAVPDKSLPIATVCTYPGIHPGYAVGDVVFVNFEEEILSQPVILGLLYTGNDRLSTSDFYANNLSANNIVKQDTNISTASTKIQGVEANDTTES